MLTIGKHCGVRQDLSTHVTTLSIDCYLQALRAPSPVISELAPQQIQSMDGGRRAFFVLEVEIGLALAPKAMNAPTGK